MIGSVLLALTVAITFDDLPANGERATIEEKVAIDRAIVATLKKRHVPAVGFVNEIGLERKGVVDPARVASLTLWLDAGLDLGNHTFSHASLNEVSLEEFHDDVMKGERVTRPLVEARGGSLTWFRHPYLETGKDLDTKRAVESFLAQHGYRVAPVTLYSDEWIFAKAYSLAAANKDLHAQEQLAHEYVVYMDRKVRYWERSARALFGRNIPQVLLLHANRLNADHLDRIAAMLKKRGYRFVTLEAAVADAAYQSPDTWVGERGISWIHRWALTKGGPSSILPDEPAVPAWVMRDAGVASE